MSLKQQIKLLELQLSDDKIDSIISTIRKENEKHVLKLKFGSIFHKAILESVIVNICFDTKISNKIVNLYIDYYNNIK